MSKIAGYIVLLSEERQNVFDQSINENKFAEPVYEFSHSRYVPLLCFIVNEDHQITHIAVGKRGNLAGTDLRRLNLTDIFPLENNIDIKSIYDSADPVRHLRLRIEQCCLPHQITRSAIRIR